MRCTKSSVVAVGHFNPAILTPGWLVGQGLLDNGQAEMDQVVGPTGFATRFKMQRLVWGASLDRFFVDAENPTEEFDEPARLMQRILERLPHTPLRAIGLNFTFEADDTRSVFIFTAGGSSVEAISREFTSALAGAEMKIVLVDDRGVQMQAVLKRGPDEGRSVEINFHRPVNGVEQADAALRTVADDQTRARKIASRFLEVKP